MRIVSFGDIHMSLQTIARLAPELGAADLVILSGDLTNFGGRDDAAQVLAATRRHAPNVLAVSGNLDQLEVIDLLRQEGVSLHGESRRCGDVGIFGCGGSNRTPFHTPTELTDEEIGLLLERAYAGVADMHRLLMVCHTPPAHTATDRISSGQHVGSPTVRAFIEEHQPAVCITGHIHESAGVDRIGRTVVLNAGALRDGGYIVVDAAADGLRAELCRLSHLRSERTAES
ncbi:MAG TPA: metallophosphoesterase family protein [Candidatus Margulisiibacteriota bacterium]|nr:metallophosphoesterase family protein [Candidatus Margulisiibacteriota bacterium]